MKNLKKIKSLNCLMVLALLMSTMHCGNAQQKDKIKLYSISIGLGYFGFDSPDSGYVTYGNASAKKK